MYSKCAISLLVLTGSVLADQSSYSSAGNQYAAPAASSGYGAPSGGGNNYAAPAASAGYAAPAAQSGYSAPAQSGYGAPAGGYDAPSAGYADYDTGYGYEETAAAPTSSGGLDPLAFIEEFIPLFLVVIAAVIAAGLLGPLFSQLLMLLVALLPGALSIKAPIIQAILGPFNLGLCNINANAAPTLVTGRSMDGFEDNEYSNYIQLFDTVYQMIMSKF